MYLWLSKHVLEKYLNSHPDSPPKNDVDEEVDNIDAPIPRVNKDSNNRLAIDIFRKPLNDKDRQNKLKVANGQD